MVFEEIADIFSETSDVKLEDRFGIRNPIFLCTILPIYLLVVLKIGPSLMKSRPAYQLKTYIICYNIFQVVACVWLVGKICSSQPPALRFWKCVVGEPGTLHRKQFDHLSILTFWLKVTELSETVVFVLRKKQRQVSFLHVFHHCSTVTLVYQSKFYPASSALYPIFLNSNVHIVMYLYYLMAAVLPTKIVAKLTPLKKAITTIQMVQFFLILLQVVVVLILGCYIPPLILAMHVGIICAFFYMFYDFYQKNYKNKKQKLASSMKKKVESN
ncbi:elongation of very long chain fatty acids protein 7-like [Episyrphus balteatus]|uniref:elongation of very long chain fatty acids protein 7-like n=1 Tax=Episyrphus balteatus TaxID=286459 RepID=UPI0024864D1A|nr:elongation of very long chain fatty acids protein 7-like [Episyrphus balteatus]